ncbi:porin family protein [Flectobacillus major]|jgi:hypothetical protein|uniref:porin family protein n=1 Tax=Flectobacillus major TaxID=103 RepID=UPI00041D2F8F|nr:porin family protein [Flectobacillus major]
MLKKLAILALFVCTSQLVKAQNVSFGPTIGVNSAKISETGATSKTGLSAGVFFNYSSVKSFGLGAQILYSQLGSDFTPGSGVEQVNLNYIQVPVLATYYFGSSQTTGSWRPKLFAGPYVGFLLNATNRNGGDANPSDLYYKSSDFGLAFGGGVNYYISKKTWLNLDIKYGLGITDIKKSTTASASNRAFSVNLGVSFPLGTIK